MGLKNFQIVFDNPWNTYYCGQPVSGKVLLTVDSAKKIRGIIIKLKGEAEVKFQESRQVTGSDGKSRTVTTHFTGNETYFETKYNLLGGANGDCVLPVGDHCYLFTSILPPNLPSSFEGEYGHVRYTVKVTIDRPWRFDQESKAAFTVISPVDLNLDPTARCPVKQSADKHFGCCCCKSGPLSLIASLPATGYVSGQQIPLVIEVDNASNQSVSSVTCHMKKLVVFHARHPHHRSKESHVTVASLSVGQGDGNGSGCWAEQLAVPPLPPSNLANCSIIDLRYELKLEAHISSCWHRNLTMNVPICLGTIPLAQQFAEQPAAALWPASPALTNGDNTPLLDKTGPVLGPGPDPGIGWSQPNALYPDLPPPSYKEAVGGFVNIRDEGDSEHMQADGGYTPRYPFYNMQPSAPPMNMM